MNPYRVSRRRFLTGALAMSAIALSGCPAPSPTSAPAGGSSGAAEPQAPSSQPSVAPTTINGGQIVVGTWGGVWEKTFKEVIGPGFTQATGVKVNYDVGTSEERLAKIRAQMKNQLIDVAALTPEAMAVAANEGMVEPLSESLIPNLASVYPQLRDVFYVNEKLMAVPASWVVSGILCRPDLIPFEIKHWKDLWRPELKQRISLQAMPTLGAASFLITSSIIHGGTSTDVEKGFQALRELKDNVRFFFKVSSDVLNQLVSGEIWAAVTIADQAVPFKDKNVAVVIPEEGTTESMQVLGIPKGSKNYDDASKFINHLLAPEIQVDWARGANAAPANMATKLPDEVQAKLYETAEVATRIWPVDFLAMGKNMQDWTERWNRELTS